MIRATFQIDRKRNPFQTPVIIVGLRTHGCFNSFSKTWQLIFCMFILVTVFPESLAESCIRTTVIFRECLEIQSWGREGGDASKPSFERRLPNHLMLVQTSWQEENALRSR